MENQKGIYYQYRSEMKYPVYLRLDTVQLEKSMLPIMEQMGFSKVEDELKNISVNRETRILKVAEANPRVAKQIQAFSTGLEAYGPESLSAQGSYQLYRYQGVGMMVFGEHSNTWEMGLIRAADQSDKVQVMLVRFLSWALASKGVLGFWAVPVEQGFVVMKQIEAKAETVFIDIDQMAMITQDGVKPITADMQILRLDETLRQESRKMTKEGLLSFLSNNTTHFSYQGVSPAMRKSLFELASFSVGVVYPLENFRHRASLSEAA